MQPSYPAARPCSAERFAAAGAKPPCRPAALPPCRPAALPPCYAPSTSSADAHLLQGCVTVNESALTGESTPLLNVTAMSPPCHRHVTALTGESTPLLNGTAMPPPCNRHVTALTGESTPLLKEPLHSLGLDPATPLCMGKHRACVVLGGTAILQHSAAEGGSGGIPPPPGGGAVGFVLRTGFHSSQGRLAHVTAM